jgi:hypothetical protein
MIFGLSDVKIFRLEQIYSAFLSVEIEEKKNSNEKGFCL